MVSRCILEGLEGRSLFNYIDDTMYKFYWKWSKNSGDYWQGKMVLFSDSFDVLGYHIDQNGLHASAERLAGISNLKTPETKKALLSKALLSFIVHVISILFKYSYSLFAKTAFLYFSAFWFYARRFHNRLSASRIFMTLREIGANCGAGGDIKIRHLPFTCIYEIITVDRSLSRNNHLNKNTLKIYSQNNAVCKIIALSWRYR